MIDRFGMGFEALAPEVLEGGGWLGSERARERRSV
jgi:hypothetical protein